ncbi:MAG: hypothetical protein CSA89_00010 [Bacteroidales bacterium]|nr:MAG: hypothetical protein CSA89_00010 [Bacteroidales bacterium]
MKNRLLFLLFVITLFCATANANPGDTTFVQTFSFEMGRSNNKVDTFDFPDGSKEYAKVLMYYTIKCDPQGTYSRDDDKDFPCGEWDYDVYTDILKPTGVVDADGKPEFDVWRLWSYITPYGINLDKDIKELNKDGWRYVYDVTDFLPLLKNKVILRDGNGQELVDIKFVFIEGTPVRKVLDIRPIWSSRGVVFKDYWEGYPLNRFDSIVHDTTFNIDEATKGVKLRTTVTGHFFGKGNNCGEFCDNKHTLKVNGKAIKEWQIIQKCGDMPMYPQGGTWVFARAGWCPGKEGKTNEFELTEYVQNGSLSVDYDVESDPYGVYRITSYLVTYSDISNKDDVEADMIITPTDDLNQRRMNPSAFAPIVVIKNNGSNILKNATIVYGFEGQEPLKFEWSGNLAFLQKDTVVLKQIPDWNRVEGQKAKFFFEVKAPNGNTDPTPYNNRLNSTCSKPAVYNKGEMLFRFVTNKRPKETYWKLTDISGNVVYSADADTLRASKAYYYNMKLNSGTYCLSLYDTNDDGLSFFANNAGNGNAQLSYFDNDKKKNVVAYRFNPVFGSFVHHWFAINNFSNNIVLDQTDVSEGVLRVFPNPSSGSIMLNLVSVEGDDLKAIISDIVGKTVLEVTLESESVNTINVSTLHNGAYTVLVKDGKTKIATGKFIVSKK